MTNEKLIAKLKLLPLRAEVKLVYDGAEAAVASISWSDEEQDRVGEIRITATKGESQS